MALVFALLGGLLLGKWIAHILQIENVKYFGPEAKILNSLGIDALSSMNWKEYLISLLTFGALGFFFLLTILMTQQWGPFNSELRPNVPFWLAFNIASSFVSNTNWQSYAGESTLSNFSQMVGLSVQNFLSAAVGVATLIVLIRALIKKETSHFGNFWNDISKLTLRIFLPISLLLALFLVSQGVPQTMKESNEIKTLEGKSLKIPLGPVASQIAIKMNGSNGGGFFNANATHPYENPTPLSNFVQTIAILLFPIACVFTFIFLLSDCRQGIMILLVMLLMLIAGFSIVYWSMQPEQVNPLTKMNFLEGTESRFSLMECAQWVSATTAVSNGSVNCMHSSLAPLAQLVSLFNMMTGEIIFGGIGSGLYTMILYVILTVFLAGLMVGRTPEYLGKKVELHEIIWVGIALLTPGLLNLICTAWALNNSLTHTGSHGLSEILYAFTSAFGNNGSSFAGLNTNTNFFNITIGLSMLIGRYLVIVACFNIAGSMGIKNITLPGPGTLRTDNFIFAFLLIAVIVIMGALTFFPALVLGPIAEHLIMNTI